MKKMMFAFACASALALFADDFSVATFEGYTATPEGGISGKDDTGTTSGDIFWLYEGAGDGSLVTAYDDPVDENKNFLNLSTEGGTLWRSFNELQTVDDKTVLGKPAAVSADTGLFVDTMVQFTATEDGGAPETAEGDKLAIWLDATGSVTTLCVRANQVVDDQGTMEPTTYKLKATVDSGKWYRLTVSAVKDITANGEGIPGFKIALDGTILSADKPTIADEEYLDLVGDADGSIADKTVFASLAGIDGDPTLQAVGFKGSGAIDDLKLTDVNPLGPDPAKTVDLTISADNATVTGITAGKVEVGAELSFTVKAADGYTVTGVTINDKTVTADEGTYKYTVSADDKAVAVVVTTEAVPSIDWDHPQVAEGTAADMFGITGDLAKADGQKLATWAKNVGKVSFDDAKTIKLDAFLLNCANDDDAVTAAKTEFVIPAITVDAEGKVTVTPPAGDYNGTVVIKGAATVDAETYDLDEDAPTAKFFKAFLVLEAPAAE